MWNPNSITLDSQEEDESWEVKAFAEDTGSAMGTTWPPRSYTCTFCRREFRSAQALGGHMNVHRRDRARLHQTQLNLKNPNLSSSNLLVPTDQHLVADGGLCFLFSLPNPNAVFKPSSYNNFSGTSNVVAPHSFNYYKSTNNEASTSIDHVSVDNKEKKTDLTDLAAEGVDLELRLGSSSSDMSLRDMLHLESFEDDDIEYTSVQQNPGDKPFLEMLKAPSFKIREPEASASTEVGGSSSAAVATTERDTGKLPEDVSASAVTEGVPKHRKKSSRKRKNDEGGSGEKVRGTPKRMKTPLVTITEVSPSVQASPSTLLETLSDHLDGGKSARDEPHVDFDESSLRHPNPSPLHSHPPMTEPSSPGKYDDDVDRFPLYRSSDDEGPKDYLERLWFGSESKVDDFTVFVDSMDLDPAVAEQKFVPNWDIKNGDKILDALTARTMMLNLNTPAEAHRHRRAAPLVLADALMMNQAQSIGLVTEVYRRWVDLEIEKEKVISLVGGEGAEEWSKKLEVLVGEKQSLEERLNQALLQVKSNSAAMALASEDRDKALKEVEGLKAERDAAVQERKMFEVEASRFRSQLEQMKKEMDGQVSKLTESNSQLTGQVKELLELKEWLMTEGMLLVARRIQTSEELKTVVGAINNAMNACGVNVGIKAGYHYSSKGMPMEQVPRLKPNADEMLNSALDKFDALEFPFLQHSGRFLSEPLEVIKAAGLSGDLFKPPST